MSRLSILGLILSAIWIWLSDPSWWQISPATLLLLIVFPGVWYLGRPWHRTAPLPAPNSGLMLAGAALFFIGVLTNISVLMVLAWGLWAWQLLASEQQPQAVTLPRLMPLMMLGFPWILVDASLIGWYFRLTAAVVNEGLFALGGFDVQRIGSHLLISGLPLDVVDDCDGLDTLQAMLIVGGALAVGLLGNHRRYWWSWPLLIAFAWLANTLRIFLFAVVGLSAGPEFAMGAFHNIGGSLSLIIMFIICLTVLVTMADADDTLNSNRQHKPIP